jgi:hypothetical protein
MKNHMSRNLKLLIVFAVLLVLTVLTTFLASYVFNQSQPQQQEFPFRRLPQPQVNPADIELYYMARTVVSTINITLLVVLIITYVSIYMKTRSEFTIGLVIFSIVFLMKDITSSPFVVGAFGFVLFGLGPFAFLPDLFELVALSVLLYLSVKY